MKRLLLGVLCMCFAMVAFSQQKIGLPPQIGNFGVIPANAIPIQNLKLDHFSTQQATDVSDWFDWLYSYGQLFGSQAITNTSYVLWPDSNVQILYTDNTNQQVKSYYVPWTSVGECFDPKASQLFTPNLSIYNDYTLDSARFFYWYERNKDSVYDATAEKNVAVVDTMILQWYVLNSTSDIWNWTSKTPKEPWGAVQFDRSQVQGVSSVSNEMRIPLTIADTAFSHLKSYAFSTNGMHVSPDGIVGATVTFHPGIKANKGDTLFWDQKNTSIPKPKNALNVFIVWGGIDNLKQQLDDPGTGTVDQFGINNGMLVNKQQRYTDVLANGFGSRYLPSSAYTSVTYPEFQFHITSSNVGIGQALHNTFKSGVYPNPAQNEAVLTYTLTKAASVNIEIYNMVGQKVQTITSGNSSAGNHQVSINTANMENGMYLYTITVNGYSETQKFSVSK